MLNVMDEQDKLKMGQMDIQYLTGLKKIFTVYMDTVRNTEPAVSTTPKLASLLNTYFSQSSSSTTQIAGGSFHVKSTQEKSQYFQFFLEVCTSIVPILTG